MKCLTSLQRKPLMEFTSAMRNGMYSTLVKGYMQSRRLIATVCAVLMVLMLSGCIFETPEPLLKVGTNQWPGYEPLYLARSLGKYDAGRIKLVELPSATETIHLLHNGTLDAGAITLDEALVAIESGLDLRIVLVMDFSNGADVLIGNPTINGLSDIKGKRIGVETNGVGAIFLHEILNAADLQIQDINVVPLTVDQHVHAFTNGKVDAVVTFEPSRTQLLRHGGIQLFDSSQAPGSIVDVLVVRSEVLDTSAGNIQLLIDGYFQAIDFLSQSPAQATTRMAPRLGITAEELLESYKGLQLQGRQENYILLTGSPSPMEVTARKMARTMAKAELLDVAVDVRDLINSSFVSEGAP